MTAAAPHRTLTIGTRASRLALWQTGRITELIESAKPGVVCRAVRFITAGDKQLDRPLPEIGGKGVFTQELENALHEGRIDLAVHSLKDLPTAQPDGLVLAAICERADARDVLISREHRTLESLPASARVGTSSPRRRAQLLAVRDDLEILPLRGNIDTRVRKALEGDYDAIVLAAAGVERLELTSAIRQYLPFEVMLPAPGQGALAIQCRAADTSVRSLLESIDDTACRAAVSAERVFLEALGGGCFAPVGAYATAAPSGDEGGGGEGGTLHLRGIVAAVDGSHTVRVSVKGLRDEAAALGRNAAQQALAEGAGALLP